MHSFPFPPHEPPYESHDDDYGPYGFLDEPWASDDLDRLTHLVLVDGRLVDTWSEPVEGTRWQRHARRFDRERRPYPPPEPPRPPYDVMLDWLDVVVGGRAKLEHLPTAPLAPDVVPVPVDGLDIRSRHRLDSAAELLKQAAGEFPDEEMGVVLRRTLLAVWETEPEVILRAKSAAHTAAGICWAAGKANGAFSPVGPLTQKELREALGLPSAPSSQGAQVRRVLQGLLPDLRTPAQAPDLLPLGRADLLTSSTRRMLLRLRDRALEAQRVHESDQVLP